MKPRPSKEMIVKVLKAECHDIRHEMDLMELRLKNYKETLELKLDRIDRIQTGDSE